MLNSETGKVRSTKLEGCQISKVQELICNGKWNKNLIKTLFSEKDCTRIESIPLSECGSKDRLVWPHSKSGQYIVKTGYFLAKEMEGRKEKIQY